MQRPNFTKTLLLATVLIFTAACSGGGGGGTPPPEQNTGPQLPAAVPTGTGAIEIDMAGTWTVQGATVVESNNSAQSPPPDGLTFVLQGDRVTSIAGLEVSPAVLTILLGPLTLYINQADGKTLFYAVTVDTRSTGGTLETTALAGGSVDDNTISIESAVSSQAVSETEPRFTRSRYLLRRSTAAPASIDVASLQNEEPFADDELALLRARLRAGLGLGN